jgi:hypothetical protein
LAGGVFGLATSFRHQIIFPLWGLQYNGDQIALMGFHAWDLNPEQHYMSFLNGRIMYVSVQMRVPNDNPLGNRYGQWF